MIFWLLWAHFCSTAPVRGLFWAIMFELQSSATRQNLSFFILFNFVPKSFSLKSIVYPQNDKVDFRLKNATILVLGPFHLMSAPQKDFFVGSIYNFKNSLEKSSLLPNSRYKKEPYLKNVIKPLYSVSLG